MSEYIDPTGHKFDNDVSHSGNNVTDVGHCSYGNAREHIDDITAAGTALVHALVAFDNAAHVDVVSPPYDRIIAFTMKNVSGTGAKHLYPCLLRVSLTDQYGNVTTEDIAQPDDPAVPDGSSITILGVKGAALVSQIQIIGNQTAQGGNDAWWQFSAGIGNTVGVIRHVADLFKVERAGLNDPVANYTTDPVYNTITPTVPWVGGQPVIFFFRTV